MIIKTENLSLRSNLRIALILLLGLMCAQAQALTAMHSQPELSGTSLSAAGAGKQSTHSESREALTDYLHQQAVVAYRYSNYQQALQLWRQLAMQGHAESQFYLAQMYRHGIGVDKDEQQAAHWYRQAAQSGHAPAQLHIGLAHAYGKGVNISLAAALQWWRRAAEQGLSEAQYNLGLFYAQGLGVDRDWQSTLHWWRRSARQGHAQAQYHLGLLYAQGSGVRRDLDAAAQWWRRAAGQGHHGALQALQNLSSSRSQP